MARRRDPLWSAAITGAAVLAVGIVLAGAGLGIAKAIARVGEAKARGEDTNIWEAFADIAGKAIQGGAAAVAGG